MARRRTPQRQSRGTNLTVSEIETLKNELIKYPYNLKYAFKEAARITRRSANTYDNAYYSRLRFREDFQVLVTGSKVGFVVNQKNIKVDENGNLPQVTLKTTTWMKKTFLKLSSEEKQQVINFFIENSEVTIKTK